MNTLMVYAIISGLIDLLKQSQQEKREPTKDEVDAVFAAAKSALDAFLASGPKDG